MISTVTGAIADFYRRNLFERILIYLFLSFVIVKLVFELILGQMAFNQSQNLQWAFYLLLASDYVFSVSKVVRLRVSQNPMSAYALVLLIMIVHGIFIGVMNRNPVFELVNDTVPLLMIALNILRMQSSGENARPIDFRFILKSCTILAIIACTLGYAAQAIGKPSGPSMGNPVVFIPLIFAAALTMKPFPKWTFFAFLVMAALTLDDVNRTSVAMVGIICGGLIALKTVQNPIKGALLFMAILLGVWATWVAVPKDSKTYVRIAGLSTSDFSQRTGSIGERQAEKDAVAAKLRRLGETQEWLGLGFGGLYEVRFTHAYITNYGHAHFAWVWYNLRFGKSGYIYLALMMLALAYNGGRSLMIGGGNGLFVAFLCLGGLLYCGTHVNSVFLQSGVHFLYLTPKNRRREELMTASHTPGGRFHASPAG